MATLNCLCRNPSVIAGGGCMETQISMYLNSFLQNGEIAKELNISFSIITNLIHVLRQTFLNVAYSIASDTAFEHFVDTQL